MPDLPNLPAAAHQAGDQAKGLARKGAQAATTLLDASFHPFRTVRNLVQTDESAPTSAPASAVPPTDAKIARPEPESATPTGPSSAAEAVAEFEVETPPDLPVVPTGPAPHLPPDIADEIERDYGDELPGFHNGDEPPGTH